MTDTTNWSCPGCGTIVSAGETHRCGGYHISTQHPLEAENTRLRAALDVAVEALKKITSGSTWAPSGGAFLPTGDTVVAREALAAIEAKMLGEG